jgi:hypothetical protein
MNGWCVAGDVPELAVVLAGPPPATVLPGNSPGVPLTVHSQAMAMARQQPELAPLVYCTLGALALLAVSTFLPIVSVLFFSFSAVNFWWGKLMLLAAIGCGAWLFTTMKPAALLATAGFLAASTAVALHLMIRMVTPEDLPETFATGLVSVGAGIYLALIAGAGGLVCAAKLYLRCQPALPHEPRPSGSLLGWIIAAGVAAHWLLFL